MRLAPASSVRCGAASREPHPHSAPTFRERTVLRSCRLLRDTDGDGCRLDPDLEPIDRLLVATVELVRHRTVELDPDLLGLRGLHELRAVGTPDRGAHQRTRPLRDAPGRDHPELEEPVLGAHVLEGFDA